MSKQQDAQFFYNFSLVLGALTLIALVAGFGANIVYRDYRISQQEPGRTADNIRPIGIANVSGAAVSVVAISSVAPSESTSAAIVYADPGERAYHRICFSCHEMGIGGAPKIGDATAWAGRPEKGIDVLMLSVINGVTSAKGVMLPRGGLPDMTDDEIRAAIGFMLGRLQGTAAAPAADAPAEAAPPAPAESA